MALFDLRNHIVDFLVTRSKSFDDAMKMPPDHRRVRVVHPGTSATRDPLLHPAAHAVAC